MKACFKCSAILPLSEFYRHGRMADGHLNKCKSCTKADVAEHREKNHAKVCAYDRARAKDGSRRKTPVEPEKRRARDAVRKAVLSGSLVPLPCEACGAEQVQAHHDDYSRPLAVRWLCFVHHRQAHGHRVADAGGAKTFLAKEAS